MPVKGSGDAPSKAQDVELPMLGAFTELASTKTLYSRSHATWSPDIALPR